MSEKFTPFAGKLEKLNPGNSHINILDAFPELVIRSNNIEHFSIEAHKQAKDLFEELREQYGVNIPKVSHVLGYRAEKSPLAIFNIAERISGIDAFSQDSILDDCAQQQIDLGLSGFATYYADRQKNREPFIGDLNSNDFVFGRRNCDRQDKLFFVDTDPFIISPDQKYDDALEENVISLAYIAKWQEVKTKKMLSQTRGALMPFSCLPDVKTLLNL